MSRTTLEKNQGISQQENIKETETPRKRRAGLLRTKKVNVRDFTAILDPEWLHRFYGHLGFFDLSAGVPHAHKVPRFKGPILGFGGGAGGGGSASSISMGARFFG